MLKRAAIAMAIVALLGVILAIATRTQPVPAAPVSAAPVSAAPVPAAPAPAAPAPAAPVSAVPAPAAPVSASPVLAMPVTPAPSPPSDPEQHLADLRHDVHVLEMQRLEARERGDRETEARLDREIAAARAEHDRLRGVRAAPQGI